jgi:hypothetical protein
VRGFAGALRPPNARHLTFAGVVVLLTIELLNSSGPVETCFEIEVDALSLAMPE